jgi:dGTPase
MPGVICSVWVIPCGPVQAVKCGAMAESADATDLKSVGSDTVRVRPPLAPQNVIARLSNLPEADCNDSLRLKAAMYFTRQQLEEIEDKSLAPYGMRSKDSKGRAYLDSEPDYRTSFQRDRDRILHTTAFRRLEYKTQVFINFEGDHFRTRLTHTLEVAQIGRTLPAPLAATKTSSKPFVWRTTSDIRHSVIQVKIALARLMKDFGGFDHNKQSLRIVTELEQRYPEFPGLNLTWEVREGMVKHESEYDISDARDFNPDLRGNLETQIANVADELAYTTHDLDDGCARA